MENELSDICGDAVLQALKQEVAYCTETLVFTSITAWCHTLVDSHHHKSMKTFIQIKKLLTFFSWTSPLSMSTRSLPYRLSLCLMQSATVFRCTARDSSSRSVAAFSSLNFAISFLTDNRHCSSTSCHRDTSVTLGRKYIWIEHVTSAISNNLKWEFKWSLPYGIESGASTVMPTML